MKGLKKWMKLGIAVGTLLIAALAWTLPQSTANAEVKTGRYEMTGSKTVSANPVTIGTTREQIDESGGNLSENCYAIMTTRLSVPIGGILAFFLLSLFLGLFMTGAISQIPAVGAMRQSLESRHRHRLTIPVQMKITSSPQKTETANPERIFLFGRL